MTALTYLKARIPLFMALPIDDIDEMTLEAKLRAIGRSEGATGRMTSEPVDLIGVKLCRPSEMALDLLSGPQQGAFAKEDGEQGIGAHGERLV